MAAAMRNGRRYVVRTRRYRDGRGCTVVVALDHHLNFLQINLPLGHDTYVHPAAASRESTNTSSSQVIRLHLYVYMSDGDSICKIRYIATVPMQYSETVDCLPTGLPASMLRPSSHILSVIQAQGKATLLSILLMVQNPPSTVAYSTAREFTAETRLAHWVFAWLL